MPTKSIGEIVIQKICQGGMTLKFDPTLKIDTHIILF